MNAINLAYDQFALRLKLRYPELKEKDIRLCCLFKLGLNSSEISIRMNLSNIAVRVRKSRLKDVLEITDTNIDLNSFLDNF